MQVPVLGPVRVQHIQNPILPSKKLVNRIGKKCLMSTAGCDPCKNLGSDERLEGSISTHRFLSLGGGSGESFSLRKKRTLVRTAESGTGTSGVVGLSFSRQECLDLDIFLERAFVFFPNFL